MSVVYLESFPLTRHMLLTSSQNFSGSHMLHHFLKKSFFAFCCLNNTF